MKEQFDFVLLQELFDEDARNYILSKIDRNIYKSVVSKIDYGSYPENLYQDAGLFLLSKYPQVDLSGVKFDDKAHVTDGAVHTLLSKELTITLDFLANKSVMGSLHQLNDSTHLFIFSTHLQALGSKKNKHKQYRQIKKFIDNSVNAVLKTSMVKSSKNIIVLLAGDFNSDAYVEKEMEALLNNLGLPRDLYSEKHPSKREYTMVFKLFNIYKRFDYIFAYDYLGTVPLKKVRIQSIDVTDVKNKNDESVSDHMALKTSLIFKDVPNEGIDYQQIERHVEINKQSYKIPIERP